MLTAVAGNLDQAVQQVQTAYCQQIQDKTGISAAAALEKLLRLHYDLDRVLNEVAREQHTATELVLQRYATRKAEALPHLCREVAHATPIRYEPGYMGGHWLPLGRLTATLSPPHYCVVALNEWFEYEDYEGFDYALDFWLAEIATVIEQQLQLPVVAGYLRTARHLQEHFRASSKAKNLPQALRMKARIAKDPAFRAAEQGFDQSRPLLLETLYDYVQERVAEFP
ncbi:hypothetical protein QMK33_10115 [Hymenobacter sp. H14-R3]|nr:hypothetical protein [Hymenobacter sp. H14-R3]